jgi:serine phosphatase RsbU (regulator of sigma subunit)
VIRRIDRSLCRLRPGLLATVFYGQVRPGRDGGLVLRWCSAGHLPPLLLDGNGDTDVLSCAGDVLLGVGTEIPRSDLAIALPADTTLLLFSDGLVETRGADLDTGVNRLRLAARPLASLDVMDLCDTLLPAMVDSRAPDDVALLAVRSSRSASAVGL